MPATDTIPRPIRTLTMVPAGPAAVTAAPPAPAGTPTPLAPLARTRRVTGPRLRHLTFKAAAPLAAFAMVLCAWQLACTLHWSATLPTPAAVWHDIATAWRHGTLAPALFHSIRRCLLGFLCSVAVAAPLTLLLFGFTALRLPLRPVLNAIQSLPAAALVPVAVICLGNSENAVFCVVLLGAVPSIVVGILSALDQVPPLLLRAGRSMGATGLTGARRILVPAAMPGIITSLKQGWTFGWRALMTAELITSTPLPGIGRMLDAGKKTGSLSLVLAATALILFVGVVTEASVFRPLERRVLRTRGLLTHDDPEQQG
ncbi:ABC transporter permease [Streptomyces sp. NPDC059443]|uniref:ABC transporter permease n=1 Tax=unclassified Streptomyces TaxID=2593676 RepID=UPI0036B4CC63